MSGEDQFLRLTFRTDEGAIGVDAVVGSLGALQRAALKVARYILGGTEELLKPGPAPERAQAISKLEILEASPGSLEFVLRVAPPQQPPLLAEDQTDGTVVLDYLTIIVAAPIDEEAWREMQEKVPDPLPRRVLLTLAEEIAPADPHTRLAIALGSRRFDLPERAAIRRAVHERIGEQVMTRGWCIGQLVQVRVAPTQKCVIRMEGGTEQSCDVAPELIDEMRQQLGELVTAIGEATYTPDGSLCDLRVTELVPVDLTPIVIREVEVGGMRIPLRAPVEIRPCIEENMLVAKHPDLGIHAYAPTRDELLAAIADEIAVIFDLYVSRSEEELDSSAVPIHREWRRLMVT